MSKAPEVVMSGEAARICGVDRRTFWSRVKKGEISPYATASGRDIFLKKDVEVLAAKIKAERQGKP